MEFLGIWEELHNPNFNYGEFAIIKSQAGLNSYKISVKEWTNKTNGIGIISKAGRLERLNKIAILQIKILTESIKTSEDISDKNQVI